MATAAPARPRGAGGPRTPSTAAQLLRNPTALTVYNPAQGQVQVSALGKLAGVFIVLMLGLDIYARSTGQTFTLDLLRPTQLFGGADQAPQPPQLRFPGGPTPPSATSPGDSSVAGGGGGHSNQS